MFSSGLVLAQAAPSIADSTGVRPWQGSVKLQVPVDPALLPASGGATVLGTVHGLLNAVNTSGAPLLISSSLPTPQNCATMSISINGMTVFSGSDGCDGGTISNTFVVPVGASYVVWGDYPGASGAWAQYFALSSSLTVLSNTTSATLGTLVPLGLLNYTDSPGGTYFCPGQDGSNPQGSFNTRVFRRVNGTVLVTSYDTGGCGF